MVEAMIALAVGGVLAFLLAGPRVGARPTLHQVPRGTPSELVARLQALPPTPLIAPPIDADPSAPPHKATQTAQRFS